MGGYVGMNLSLDALRDHSLKELADEAKARGEIYMIHPDDKGCIFLEKRNGRHFCKIHHYRPRTCRGFKCNLADNSFMNILGDDAIWLLNQNRYGMRLE
jgi:Fe-S-cluster containining protein